tara:strand:- start:22 stop:717 length:696 start_codon:yes stop_codon:yes gene_type:complete
MWIFGKPFKILFFKNHIENLIKSIKAYDISDKKIKKDILFVIKKNLKTNYKYNHLLRIALNKNILSFSLRRRMRPKLDFNLKLINHKRQKPDFKNLKYKKILSYLSKLDNTKSDIGLCFNKKIFETGTSNLLFIKNNQIYSPKDKFYKGITYNFFKKKIKKIIHKDIYVKMINQYDEIILIGSGKGVASVKTIKNINWRRKSLKFYKILLKYYLSEIKNCPKLNINDYRSK